MVVPSHTHGFTTGGHSADHSHGGNTGNVSSDHAHNTAVAGFTDNLDAGAGTFWTADSGRTTIRRTSQGSSGSSSVTDDTVTDATRYPTFVDVTSGTPTATNVSSSKLTFNPSTGTLSATVFTSLSDKTQKTDITPITNAIETVKQLNGVKYKWIDDHNQPSIGVIAQEIEKVLPEVVTTNENGIKSVSYGNIVGLLIEAIKEQQIRIEKLERKLNK